ncbi:MAG: NADH-quinone oxidoreductase subunit H [Actinobacteria bacterium]|nr:NADH-quinone oxidoreductase subunit H [Actinomycetota bacterium]
MSFAVLLTVKVLAVLGLMLGGALVVIYAELKVGAHMQNRIGPYFAGGRFGWAQPFADALKFMQKEDLVPDGADDRVYKLAPYVVLMGTIGVFVVLPLSPRFVARDLDLGAFYALAISSLTTLGVLMAGWSSNNKYSLIGGLRAAAQLIAYELPLVLAVVAVAIQAGTLSISGIIEAQAAPAFSIGELNVALPYILTGQIIGFAIFVVASLAELSRIPFDMPIAESELTMGFVTEYSSIRFAMFFLAEYAGMVSMSALATAFYLGGYQLPGLSATAVEVLGPVIFISKVFLLSFLFIWLRWTLPRFREDQLQSLAWRWLIPAALLNIAITATFKVVF